MALSVNIDLIQYEFKGRTDCMSSRLSDLKVPVRGPVDADDGSKDRGFSEINRVDIKV